MNPITSSVALETYIKDMCKNKRHLKNHDGETVLSLFFAFGAARKRDDLLVKHDFDDSDTLDDIAECMAQTQDSVEEPKVFVKNKDNAAKTLDKPALVEEYVNKLYHDIESPLFHGFTIEMKTAMVNRLIMDSFFGD